MSGPADFYQTISEIYTDAECQDLAARLAGLPSAPDPFSPVHVAPIPPESWKTLYAQMYTIIATANERRWRIALDGWLSLQALRYEAGAGYARHTDFAEPPSGGRVFKLAMSVLLSPPTDFSGGELELMLGSQRLGGGVVSGPSFTPPLGQGAGLLFPSYIIHRVRPVATGTRVVLVGWRGTLRVMPDGTIAIGADPAGEPVWLVWDEPRRCYEELVGSRLAQRVGISVPPWRVVRATGAVWFGSQTIPGSRHATTTDFPGGFTNRAEIPSSCSWTS
jgi:hypothetical protein